MPPCDAATTVYGLQKVRYRLYDRDGEAELKSRLDHIYDFQDKHFTHFKTSCPPVKLQGKTSRKRSYREVKLSSGLRGWSTCSA
ncbi:hypothetical protein J3458_005420 [Metarhizium acridum]|uniref:uncharacterized protein n=1 Tax=Metarhizium acridum TaxID=92637 RepID=UPI001C6ABF35|nr:hypothetical protein J3458_005420 [Metarhizium acridum]